MDPELGDARLSLGEERRVSPELGGLSVNYSEMCIGLHHRGLTESELQEHWSQLTAMSSDDNGFSEFAAAAVEAYRDQMLQTPHGDADFCTLYEDAALPTWLSPAVFGPCLRKSLCSCPAAELQEQLQAMTSTFENHPALEDIRVRLQAACTSAGGRAVWAMLVAEGQSDESNWQVWREILWRLGIAVLEQSRRQIAMCLQEWSLRSVSMDWGRQLIELEETIGWCIRMLDMHHASPNSGNGWSVPQTDRPDVVLAAAHIAAATHVPTGPAFAMLQADPRRKLRSLESERFEKIAHIPSGQRARGRPLQGKLSPLSHILTRDAQLDAHAQHAAAAPLLLDAQFVSFHDFRQMLSQAASSKCAVRPSSPSKTSRAPTLLPRKPSSCSKKRITSFRLRELRIS